jgi:hypothetical protein
MTIKLALLWRCSLPAPARPSLACLSVSLRQLPKLPERRRLCCQRHRLQLPPGQLVRQRCWKTTHASSQVEPAAATFQECPIQLRMALPRHCASSLRHAVPVRSHPSRASPQASPELAPVRKHTEENTVRTPVIASNKHCPYDDRVGRRQS